MTQIQNHWLDTIAVRQFNKIMKLFNDDYEDFIKSFGNDIKVEQKELDAISNFVKDYGKKPNIKKLIKEWKANRQPTKINTRYIFGFSFKTKDGYVPADQGTRDSCCFFFDVPFILNKTK